MRYRLVDLSWAEFDAKRKAERAARRASTHIHKSDLTTTDARRSREVSPEEFDRIRARGARRYARLTRRSSPTTGLEKNWRGIKADAYNESMKDWGGATYDAHTGKKLASDADLYAITARPPGMPSVQIPEGSSRRVFGKAMETAKARYQKILERENHHLGVFHDNDQRTIDIDPVATVDNMDDVEAIGAYTKAVGGAYHFKSGNGFWPPHVRDEAKSA